MGEGSGWTGGRVCKQWDSLPSVHSRWTSTQMKLLTRGSNATEMLHKFVGLLLLLCFFFSMVEESTQVGGGFVNSMCCHENASTSSSSSSSRPVIKKSTTPLLEIMRRPQPPTSSDSSGLRDAVVRSQVTLSPSHPLTHSSSTSSPREVDLHKANFVLFFFFF